MDTGITKDQFVVLVKAMKAVYPKEDFLPDNDAAKVWYALLKDLDYKTLSNAVQRHLMTSPFPPTIADLRKLTVDPALDELSDMMAWDLVRKALGNSAYHADEEFQKLPPVVRRAVGSPGNLKDMATMDTETVNSVIQSNFLRNYKTAKARERENLVLSPSVRERIGAADTLLLKGE